jgi:hypothetical protein
VSRLPRKVALGWRPSSDPTVKGYVVLRSPGAAGPFEPIAELAGRHRTHYVDHGLGDLHVFYYQLRAINTAGALGAPSEPVQGLTKPDPLPPVGLHIAGREGSSFVLVWAPNVEPDVVAYRVPAAAGDDAADEAGTVRALVTCRDDDAASGERLVPDHRDRRRRSRERTGRPRRRGQTLARAQRRPARSRRRAT